MTRVLAIADEETLDLPRLRDLAPDLVLAAGDLPWDHLEFVASALEVPMAFVPGNHDPEIVEDRWEGARPHGFVNADGRVVEIGGLRIAGLGGCVRYRPGPHQYSQRQFRRRATRLIRAAKGAPIDVLLTHAPPAGLGDEDDAPHQGVEALHAVIDRLAPTWHLHGHIHPYGQVRPDRHIGPTTVRNVVPFAIIEVERAGHGA